MEIPENNPLLKEIGVMQAAEKIEQTPESELKSKEKTFQLGLFYSYTATQSDEQNNSYYDFDEMDDEEEILPGTIEKQNEVEFSPQEDSQV